MNHTLKILAAISILLNLLLVGIILGNAGQYLFAHEQPKLQELAAVLPKDKREALNEKLQQAITETDALRAQLTNARAKAVGMIKAESFDRNAYLTQVQLIKEIRLKLTQHMGETIAMLASEATRAERIAIADMLPHPPHQ